MDHVQTVVVGAGVIGLAVARRLARAGHEVLILEAEAAIGQHTSSHNSQVIHAGIYYLRDSFQRRLCVPGKAMLYDYCRTRQVGHSRCGKMIVATRADQVPRLLDLQQTGLANGLDDLRVISADEARKLEPQVAAFGALLSPSTGIVDAPGLMLSLLGEAEAAGAMLALKSPMLRGGIKGGVLALEVGDTAKTRLTCTNLINAAGHGAWDVARGIDGLAATLIPPRFMARGSYFALTGQPSPFRQLIYPLPDAGSLGLHSVLDLGGQVKFGPDMDWIDVGPLEYGVDSGKLAKFEAAVRQYWPALPDGALVPESSGLRPRIWGPKGKKTDFLFQGPRVTGVPGLTQMFGMESPGLTSCLAIARHVAALVDGFTPEFA